MIFFSMAQDIILSHLLERYLANQIYTYIGDILIAVNPLKTLNLYGPEVSLHAWVIKMQNVTEWCHVVDTQNFFLVLLTCKYVKDVTSEFSLFNAVAEACQYKGHSDFKIIFMTNLLT